MRSLRSGDKASDGPRLFQSSLPLPGAGDDMSPLTPEERYQLETIRLRHAADEDHMESGDSDGREWTFTAICIHGQRGDLLRIVDRLNAAATRGQDPMVGK